MNILCVCGNGIGTSVLLKVNVESVAADLGVDVNVTTSCLLYTSPSPRDRG